MGTVGRVRNWKCSEFILSLLHNRIAECSGKQGSFNAFFFKFDASNVLLVCFLVY